MRIGVAGTGKMGAAIAARLIDVGHHVAVWNRTAEKARAVKGAKLVAEPVDLTRQAEAVISILTDAAALDAVCKGASGLIAGEVSGKLFIEMSTVSPATEMALAEAVRQKGGTFAECPVGGSTGPARQGKLIGLLGADEEAARRAGPILEQLCRRIEHAGPVGNGALLKFTINLPLMVYWQALGEALALARSLPIEPGRLMDLLGETSGGPNVLKARGAGVASMLKGGDPGPVTFNIDSGIKDMQAMLAEARQRQIELPLVQRALACYEEARHGRSGGAEISSVSVYWATRGKR